jgi:hypothetical protein
MRKLVAPVIAALALAVLASACGGAQRPRTDPAYTYKCISYNANGQCKVTL